MADLQCRECGRIFSDLSPACPHCGFPVWRAPVGQEEEIRNTPGQLPPSPAKTASNASNERNGPADVEMPEMNDISNIQPRISTHLGLSIGVTILCCLPFGVVAIVFSAMAQNELNLGRWDLAEYYAQRAHNWNIAAIVTGAGCILMYILLPYIFALILMLVVAARS